MKTWIISDSHLYHLNIIKYCNRPFSDVEEMNKAIINNWNSKVSKDDIVYHLGDFALGSGDYLDIVKNLNGRKFLIMGNHDTKTPKHYLECGFEFVSKNPIIIQDKYILSHHPRQGDIGRFKNIHGHCHWIGKKDISGNHFDASCERINYTPILLDEIIKIKNW